MRGRLAATLAGVPLLLAAACSDSSGNGTDAPPTSGQEPVPAPTDATFPAAEWERATPEELGFDPAELERLAADAKAAGSDCLLVVKDGKVVGEWTWNDLGEPGTREVFSATKSYTSTLVGIAQADGLLDIDDRAAEYIPEWRGTDAEDVTIRNLLSNDSGRQLDPELEYGDEGLGRAGDQNEFAVALEQEAPPGTTWGYNNAAIQTLDAVLQAATGQDTAAYAEEKLLDPIGMTSSEMSHDPSGNTVTYMGLRSNCQEMARFGHLFLNRGRWGDEQVVPAKWVDEATSPSQDLNVAYGYLWWLNRRGPVVGASAALQARPAGEIENGQLVEDAPQDMYFALGLAGQVIAVDPGSGTVVVRLGGGEFTPQDAADLITKTQG